jgi:hypothetical protein
MRLLSPPAAATWSKFAPMSVVAWISAPLSKKDKKRRRRSHESEYVEEPKGRPISDVRMIAQLAKGLVELFVPETEELPRILLRPWDHCMHINVSRDSVPFNAFFS